MRIARLKAVGFRGIRELLDLDLPSTFTVITGRNGAGKSTICDAIEFGLTGALSKPYMHVEKKEDLLDYIWWRGPASTSDHFVQLTLIRDNGEAITITRRPDAFLIDPPSDLGRELCDPESAPANPLDQLCRTSIIRDESITETSIDLNETERFRFVQNAVGTSSLTAVAAKTDEVQRELERRQQTAEGEYLLMRTRVEALISQLSLAEAQRARGEDVVNAENTLRTILSREAGSADSLIEATREHLTASRQRIAVLEEIQRQLVALNAQRDSLQTPLYQERLKGLESEIEELQGRLEELGQERGTLDKEISLQESQSPRLASLAELHAQGRRLGLENDHCPLCGSAIAEDSFQQHLDGIQRFVSQQHDRLASLTERRATVAAAEREVQARLGERRRSLDVLRLSSDSIAVSYQRLADQLERVQLEGPGKSPVKLTELGREVGRSRNENVEIEAALAAVESSIATNRATTLRRDLEAAQAASAQAEEQVTRAARAVDRAKTIRQTITRVANEIGEERLASLSPLMDEFYRRLRPHADWTEIHYRMRGDVRRFVSLTVGDDLNPRFMFSSGQRRALGLAFLLAVHMSREWCRLRTLILDDPVQHVDDYRALHLAEVLSSIRRANTQVICTVEDSALASLLTRRLRGTPEEGSLITMAYDLGQGIYVQNKERIRATKQMLLQQAS